MSQTYRLRIQRASLKLKVASRIPALLAAESPIILTRAGANYTFSLSIDALRDSLDDIYVPVTLFSGPLVITGSSAAVVAGTRAIAIQRTAPSATAISLPAVLDQDGMPLSIIDWSSSVTDHTITLTPDGSETIMLAATWPMYSNAASLASLTLYPSTTLGGWYIAP